MPFTISCRVAALALMLAGSAQAATPTPQAPVAASSTPPATAPHATASAMPASARAAAPTAGAGPSDRLRGVSPADAYYGPFGMSPLSIRSTIGLLGRQYHYRTITDRDLLRKALITEDALRRWRTKYPADPWLAPTFYHLEQLYQAVQTDEARKHATAMLNLVVKDYPSTKEGHLSRSRLAAGFPPLVAESPLVTPSPAAATADASSSPLPGSPDASPTTPPPPASPLANPSATRSPAAPGPTAMPTAGATPVEKRGTR